MNGLMTSARLQTLLPDFGNTMNYATEFDQPTKRVIRAKPIRGFERQRRISGTANWQPTGSLLVFDWELAGGHLHSFASIYEDMHGLLRRCRCYKPTSSHSQSHFGPHAARPEPTS